MILFNLGKTFILQGYFPRLPYQPSNTRATDMRDSAILFFSHTQSHCSVSSPPAEVVCWSVGMCSVASLALAISSTSNCREYLTKQFVSSNGLFKLWRWVGATLVVLLLLLQTFGARMVQVFIHAYRTVLRQYFIYGYNSGCFKSQPLPSL